MNGKKEHTVISLFAGCGGSSLGYKMAGFKELLAIDFDKNAVETFKLNFKEVPIWQKDIRQIKGEDILDFCNIKEGVLDVLDGSPPCQGFSTAGKRKVYDKRNDLVLEYIRLVDELQPKVFIMENVSGMVKGTMKGLFKEYMLKMKALNYVVKCKLMNAKYYNVPQSRERLIWIGVRKDLNKEGIYPTPSKKVISFEEILNFKGVVHRGLGYDRKTKKTSQPVYTLRKSTPLLFSSNKKDFQRLSIEDVKKLHSFNTDFKILGIYNQGYAQIGNSVPPNFMYAIAKTVKEEILT